MITKIIMVYHGTSSNNFRSIIEHNFKEPDGVRVRMVHGSVYGTGIYAAPDYQAAVHYAGGTQTVILCIAVPGKQYAAHKAAVQGRPIAAGYDSHYSADAAPDGGPQLVF